MNDKQQSQKELKSDAAQQAQKQEHQSNAHDVKKQQVEKSTEQQSNESDAKKQQFEQSTEQQQKTSKSELELLREQLAATTETAKRAMADLINYRKRIEEERNSMTVFVTTAILLEIISILDNFKRAISVMAADQIPEDHRKGIESIAGQITALLNKYGVKEFESKDKKFDPYLHEAIAQAYMIGRKVLRPAKVKVGNGEKTTNQ